MTADGPLDPGDLRALAVDLAQDPARWRPHVKTIKSAAANAGDLKGVNPNLFVASAWVGAGPVLKRMRAHAMGRGATYKRKTCHLTIVVSDGKGN